MTVKIPKINEIPVEDQTSKGYNDFVVQGLEMKPHNIRYRLERWESPDGRILTGKLPAELNGSHFDVYLKRFILYQYYHNVINLSIEYFISP